MRTGLGRDGAAVADKALQNDTPVVLAQQAGYSQNEKHTSLRKPNRVAKRRKDAAWH
jgi:hypothetical protein